jgi:transposase
MLEEEAKKRQGARNDLPNIVTKVSQGKSREQASKIFDVGTTYIQQIKKIKENHPEKLEAIKSGKYTLQDIKKEERKEKILKQREELP